jgi:hypothetical protein
MQKICFEAKEDDDISKMVGKVLFIDKKDFVEIKSIDDMVAETRRKMKIDAIKGKLK